MNRLYRLKPLYRFIFSLVEHFNKNHENAKCPDFQFHNLKFSLEKYLHVTTASDIYMKEEIESCLRRAL